MTDRDTSWIWTSTENSTPLTEGRIRETFEAEKNRPLQPRPHLPPLHPDQFDALVRFGYIDKDGRWLTERNDR